MSFETVTIGPCTLIRGDCREVLPTLRGVDAVVTDPPYGISRDNHGGFLESRGQIANDHSTELGQSVVDFCDDNDLPLAVFASPRKPFAGNWRNLIVWDKGEAVAGGGDPSRCLKLSWELIQVSRNGIMDGAREGSVWRHPITQQDFDNHPNEKPVGLMERLVSKLFADCTAICDPMMGSGTTGVACIKTGRKFIGIEIEPKYFEIACERIRKAWKLERSKLPLEPQARMVQRELIGA